MSQPQLKMEAGTSMPVQLSGIPRGAEALALDRLLRESGRSVLYITTSDREMNQVMDGLAFFARERETLALPAWDCLPYDRASPNPAIVAQRIATLSALTVSSGNPRIVVTTVNAALQRLPARSVMRDSSFTAKIGINIDRDRLSNYLIANGYRRLGKVMEPGEFALRGSIIDLFPPGYEQALRLDLFGDTLESIRTFDPLSQVSDGKLEQFTLHPMSEVILSDDAVNRFRAAYRERFGAVTKEDPLYEAVSEGRAYPGMEHWLPLFHERLETIFDYLPGAVIVAAADAETARADRFELMRDYYDARKNPPKQKHSPAPPYHPLPPEMLYLREEEIAGRETVVLSPFDGSSAKTDFRSGKNFGFARANPELNLYDAFREHVTAKRAEGKRTLLACMSNGSRERLRTLLSEHGFHVVLLDGWQQRNDISGKSVGLVVFGIESGFETAHTVLVSEPDLLGERMAGRARKKRTTENFMAEAANLIEGELVVHREHGIGRFEGLVKLEVSGAAHDCLKLVYEGDDKLFLPVENIELVSRFGAEEEGAKLDKLGSASWQARKAKIKERITIAAAELLKTAAERQVKQGAILQSPSGLYDEFVARFPYSETDDQDRAIDEVLTDMQSGKPMDRLICGDVGFGKTEVALRAAFAAVTASEERTQVAVVTPTTLLSRQHFRTFSERFDGMRNASGKPIVVRQLSRLVSTKDSKQTIEGLKDGSVDVVVGTHALLAKSVAFDHLGLVVVDEEQHFGVAQKEKLKALKSDVHVLTMSATPIPRTLQMALTGVRDLSLITTPPVDRLAIRSFVMPFDPVVIREAIMREYHRGGKIFYVTPRIKDIAELKTMLAELVPDVKVGVAHGQMPPKALDDIMNQFYEGKFNILLSTAIIESGLDIPTANTIIINRADRFGLAQLYQMRGRVGRGKTRAYAYFTLPHHKVLSRAATRRLEVMQTLDTLGAGFSVASHDMDIRGFGNLVGEEQSGHVREVGIELYQQMLEEAVEALRRGQRGEEPVRDEWSPQINLGMAVLIPETYVSDLPLRLGLYRRVSQLMSDEEIDAFAAELVDRFGAMPEEVEHLLAVMRIKLLCKQAGIERIDAGPKGLVIAFRGNRFAKPEKLLDYIARHPLDVKLRPDQRLVLLRDWEKAEEKKLGETRAAVAEIAKMAQS